MLKEIINRYKIQLIFSGDVFSFYLSLLLMLIIRHKGENILIEFQKHFYPFTILLIVWVVAFYVTDLYSYTNLNSTIENKKKLLISISVSFVLSLSIFYIFGNFFSISPKTNLVIFTIIFTLVDYSLRYFFSWFLKQKYNHHKILLLSNSILNETIIGHIERNPQLGYLIKKIDKENFLKEDTTDRQNTTIVIDRQSFDNIATLKKLYVLASKNVEIISLENFYEKLFMKIPLDEINEKWFINKIKSKNQINENLKVAIDKLLAIAGFIALLPLFLVIFLLIKFNSRGPILYRQTRVGFNNKNFTLFKFRTMYNSLDRNPDANSGAPTWCQKNDRRITPIGKILRKTHLDEMPQLFNIIRSDLSFVGPRPERPEFVEALEKEIPHYLFRQIIKPGLTGWAQIRYRYSNTIIESKEKFEYDLYYIKNKNIFFDLKIMLKTIQFVFNH